MVNDNETTVKKRQTIEFMQTRNNSIIYCFIFTCSTHMRFENPFFFSFFFKFCFCLNALSFFAESMCFCSYLFKIDGCWFCQMLQWICCACVFCICLHAEFGMIISKLKYILRCGLLWQIQTHLKNSYKSKVRNSIDL